MTAPTPHEELAESVKVDWELDHALVEKALGEFNDLAKALAAVTAERDQALEALAAANKLGAFETGKTIGAAEVRKELDQALKMLEDAPHERGCGMTRLPGYLHSGECFCWKAGL